MRNNCHFVFHQKLLKHFRTLWEKNTLMNSLWTIPSVLKHEHVLQIALHLPEFLGMGWLWTFPLRRQLPDFWILSINTAFFSNIYLRKKVWVIFKPFLKITADLHMMLFLFIAERIFLTNPMWQFHNIAHVLDGLSTIFQNHIPESSNFSGVMPVDGYPEWGSSTDVLSSLECLNQSYVRLWQLSS